VVIIIIGQAAFGAGVLEGLLARSEEIVAVYTPPDNPGRAVDALKSTALEHAIPLAFVPRIIPVRYLEWPTRDSICFHPSLLPRHRGASAINWALIMGDTKTGLSIFWPDTGIDTGPILLQREIEIGPDDTAGSLYFNHLFPRGIEALLESVELIKKGKAPRIDQDDEDATYEPPCDDRVAGIDWEKPAREIYNLVRGCDPQPGAYAFWKNEKIRFYSAGLTPGDAAEKPGTIVQVDSEAIRVALNGGILIVGKVRSESTGKVTAGKFASKNGLTFGVRFANAP
jgi:methionyl-tRNA formyltransferase